MPDFLFLEMGLLLLATLSPDSAPHKNKEQFPRFNVPTCQCQTAGDRLGGGGEWGLSVCAAPGGAILVSTAGKL